MSFQSKELNSAVYSQPNITHVPSISIDIESLKNELRIFILTKDKNLLNIYDAACLNRSKSFSGIENIINLLNILNEFFLLRYKEDQQKTLTIRKIFEAIYSSLKVLQINGVDCNPNEINTLILGFLVSNFI